MLGIESSLRFFVRLLPLPLWTSAACFFRHLVRLKQQMHDAKFRLSLHQHTYFETKPIKNKTIERESQKCLSYFNLRFTHGQLRCQSWTFSSGKIFRTFEHFLQRENLMASKCRPTTFPFHIFDWFISINHSGIMCYLRILNRNT